MSRSTLKIAREHGTRVARAALALALCAGAWACTDRSRGQPPVPVPDLARAPDLASPVVVGSFLPHLRFEPPDLTSSIGTTPLRVVIDEQKGYKGVTRLLPPGGLATVASLVSLHTYPGDAVVPTTLQLKQAQEIEGELVGETSITLVPAQPLSPQWYALVVSPAVAQLVFVDPIMMTPWAKKLPDGRLIARFHPSVQPVVRVVQVGMKTAKVGITFSERVVSTKKLEDQFTITQGGKPLCQPGYPVEGSYLTYVYSCPTLDPSLLLTVTIADGIYSNTPAQVPLSEVKGGPAQPIQFVPDQHPGIGHWTWTPPP